MIVAQGGFEDRRLFGNLFRHKVLIAAFVHTLGINGDPARFAIGQSTIFVVNLCSCAGDHGKITLFQIGDFIGQRGQCDGI